MTINAKVAKRLWKRFEALYGEMMKHPDFEVECWLGEPAGKNDGVAPVPEDEEHGEWLPDVPDELMALARVHDGGGLKWTYAPRGKKAVSGKICIASIEELRERGHDAPMEMEENWDCLDVTIGRGSYVSDAFNFFNGDDYVKGEDLPLEVVIDLALNACGIKGWELHHWQHGLDTDEEFELRKRSDRQRKVVGKALGLQEDRASYDAWIKQLRRSHQSAESE